MNSEIFVQHPSKRICLVPTTSFRYVGHSINKISEEDGVKAVDIELELIGEKFSATDTIAELFETRNTETDVVVAKISPGRIRWCPGGRWTALLSSICFVSGECAMYYAKSYRRRGAFASCIICVRIPAHYIDSLYANDGLVFTAVSDEWREFVFTNRGLRKRHSSSGKSLVVGPIAGSVALDSVDAVRPIMNLSTGKPYRQYVFTTEKTWKEIDEFRMDIILV